MGQRNSAELGPAITSRSNARAKALRAALSGKASQPGDLLGLEGEHLLGEAKRSGLTLETVYVRNDANAQGRFERWQTLQCREWMLLAADIFDSAVSTATPQGIAATWRIEEPKPPAVPSTVLVLEDIKDPGNLGTLLRTAEAFGTGEVMVTPRTANQWNPKTVRSSAGSVFRIPVSRLPLTELSQALRGKGVRLFAAVAGFTGKHSFSAPHGVLFGRSLNTEAEPGYTDSECKRMGPSGGYVASLSYDADFLQPWALLIGNEGSGLSAEALAAADEQVQIPCSVESLNAAVAGSVLMYEAMRQLPLRAWAHKQGLRP